ncbi:MAG: class I tRNA ligase family protein, partial [Bacteroidia bacterium]|nr:class I tRNA ligase family protein [Bacteroidia bacterium]
YMGEKPFTNVYLTGIVRDQLGRKMSKSLGNSPDPLDLIKMYGADAIRVGVLYSSPAGNDLMFDTPLEITPATPLVSKYCEQGRNFWNKIWNAFKLIKGFEVNEVEQNAAQKQAIDWFANRLNEQLAVINNHYDKYRMSDALMATYKLVWDDFCAYYLEAIKPEFIDGKALPIDKATYDATINFLEDILKIVHPWMPFVTEEIWHLITERSEKDCIIVAEWPKVQKADADKIKLFEQAKEIVTQVRNIRNQKNISPKEKMELQARVQGEKKSDFNEVIVKLANLSAFTYTDAKPEGAVSFVIPGTEFFVPLTGKIDTAAEKERILKEIEYNKGFLKSVQIKLSNQNFVAKAKPELIEKEKQKQSDAESKIKSLEEQLQTLNS